MTSIQPGAARSMLILLLIVLAALPGSAVFPRLHAASFDSSTARKIGQTRVILGLKAKPGVTVEIPPIEQDGAPLGEFVVVSASHDRSNGRLSLELIIQNVSGADLASSLWILGSNDTARILEPKGLRDAPGGPDFRYTNGSTDSVGHLVWDVPFEGAVLPPGNYSRPVLITADVPRGAHLLSLDFELFAARPRGEVLWSLSLLEYGHIGTPVTIGTDGALYVGLYDTSYTNSTVIKLSADGQVAWRFPIEGYCLQGATHLTASDNAVYGVAIQDNGWRSLVFAISTESGELVWSKEVTDMWPIGGPALHPSGQLIVSGFRSVRSFSLQDGSCGWIHQFTEGRYETAPVIGFDGGIYVYAHDVGCLVKISPDGVIAWVSMAGVTSGPWPDGTVSFDNSGNLIIPGTGLWRRVSAADGSVLSDIKPDLSNEAWAGPAVVDAAGQIYAVIHPTWPSWDATLYSFDADGNPRWIGMQESNYTYFPTVLTDGTLWVVSSKLQVFDCTTGTRIQVIQPSNRALVYPPTVNGGVLYTCDWGGVRAIWTGAQVVDSAWPTHAGDAKHTGVSPFFGR